MKISVLIPTLGERKKEIKRLLDSLNDQVYKNFEVIFVTQINHKFIEDIIKDYINLDIKQVKIENKGLSRSRNVGLKEANGEIVILSDDDCWYPKDAFKSIIDAFDGTENTKIVLSQIFDPEKKILYKQYDLKQRFIKNKLQLMSKSSIEIAFKKDLINFCSFDERFGLGSNYICGEEVDFLIRNFEKNSIYYIPKVTVYHNKKDGISNKEQIVAKGALYGKNFNFMICLIVLFRDLIIKKENNFRYFFIGYNSIES